MLPCSGFTCWFYVFYFTVSRGVRPEAFHWRNSGGTCSFPLLIEMVCCRTTCALILYSDSIYVFNLSCCSLTFQYWINSDSSSGGCFWRLLMLYWFFQLSFTWCICFFYPIKILNFIFSHYVCLCWRLFSAVDEYSFDALVVRISCSRMLYVGLPCLDIIM